MSEAQRLFDKLVEVEIANQRVMMLSRRLASLEEEIFQLRKVILAKPSVR
jgi:hypothetical protein